MKRSALVLLRISIALLLGTVAFDLFLNLSAVYVRPAIAPAAAGDADQLLRFVVVAPQDDHSFWTEVSRGAREAGGSVHADVEFIAPRRPEVDDLVQLLGTAAAGQVDGIITQGIRNERVAQAIADAADLGIPVITVGADLPSNRLAYVGVDNYRAARMAAEDLMRRVNGRAVVGIIRADFGPVEEDERVRGFRDGLAGDPAARIVAVESSDLGGSMAGQAALRILRAHPEVNALYCTTAPDTVGVAQSLTALGSAGRIALVGWDVQPDDAYVASGAIAAVVGQDGAQIGRWAVTLLEAYRRRDARPPSVTFLPAAMVDAEDKPW